MLETKFIGTSVSGMTFWAISVSMVVEGQKRVMYKINIAAIVILQSLRETTIFKKCGITSGLLPPWTKHHLQDMKKSFQKRQVLIRRMVSRNSTTLWKVPVTLIMSRNISWLGRPSESSSGMIECYFSFGYRFCYWQLVISCTLASYQYQWDMRLLILMVSNRL